MTATCHPEKEHAAKGLCYACYRRSRYKKEYNRAKCASYYARNSEPVREKRRKRYYSQPLEARRLKFTRYKSQWVRPPAPARLSPSIQQWWKKAVKELPVDWQVETKRPKAKKLPPSRSVRTISYSPLSLDRGNSPLDWVAYKEGI